MTATTLGLAAQLIVAGTALGLLFADAVFSEKMRRHLAALAAAGVFAALAVAVAGLALAAGPGAGDAAGAPGFSHQLFDGAIAIDGFTLFFQVLFLGLALLVLMLSPAYLRRHGREKGEFFILLVAALAGMMLTVAATSLITIFLGIELLSIPLYVLSAFLREEQNSQEAGVKYLLIGGFASGFLLYGMSLLFGGTGTLSVSRIALVLPRLGGDELLLSVVGIALILVGLAFKASAAPFHTWTPDVYQGAPAPVVAFMSVGTKVAAVAVFLRLFVVGFPGTAYFRWSVLLGAVAAVSMIVGSLGALLQSNLKRLLAYSSVAQAGYLLLAAVAGSQQGMVSGLFFLAGYGVMTFGAFGVISILAADGSDRLIVDDLRGLAFRRPALGGLMFLFMLSLAGIPPTVGFFGKLFVFEAAIQAGYIQLTVVAIVASVISLYYYLRVAAILYARPEGEGAAPVGVESAGDRWGTGAVTFAGVLTLLLGIFPGLLYGLAQRSSLL